MGRGPHRGVYETRVVQPVRFRQIARRELHATLGEHSKLLNACSIQGPTDIQKGDVYRSHGIHW